MAFLCFFPSNRDAIFEIFMRARFYGCKPTTYVMRGEEKRAAAFDRFSLNGHMVIIMSTAVHHRWSKCQKVQCEGQIDFFGRKKGQSLWMDSRLSPAGMT